MIKQEPNRTVLITGASGGVGMATARRFAVAGFRVILHANRNFSAVEELCDEIRKQDRQAETFSADFSLPNTDEALLQSVFSITDHVDVLVNAAGLDLMSPMISAEPFDKKLQQLLQIDVVIPVHLSRKIGKRMKERKRGSIFFLGWNGVEHGWKGETAQLYGTVKGALLGFSRSLAEDLAPDVLVRCLSLGWIKTRWGKNVSEETARRYAADSLRNRWGTPEEVAAAIEFLSKEESALIDGIGLPLDGGKRGHH